MNEKVTIEGGATLWARQTIDSEIFYEKPDKYFKIWFYLVNRVNHKKKRKWERGECFLNYQEVREYTKSTTDQVKKCISWLKKERMISTARSTRGVNIKILKYDHFQRLDNYYYDVKSSTKAPQSAPEKHQRSTTINKNDKNDKNIHTTCSKNKSKYFYGVDKLGRDILLVNGNYRVKGVDGEFYDYNGELKDITKQ